MSEDLLDYPIFVREALLGVVRRCLGVVVEHGLPGDHHFYISFLTTAPGVELGEDLLARFPQEMTIVLQHQYRDLELYDDVLAITLSFGGKWRRLVVPWDAITSFVDPAAHFGLPLAPMSDEESEAPAVDGTAALAPTVDAEPARVAEVVSIDAFRKR